MIRVRVKHIGGNKRGQQWCVTWYMDYGLKIFYYPSYPNAIANTFSQKRNKPHNLKWEDEEITIKEVEEGGINNSN